MKWRVLVWIAAATAVAAAAGLGVDVAVAGTDKAAGLAGIIVGFCELAAVVLAVVGLTGQRRTTEAGSQVPRRDPGAKVGDPADSARAPQSEIGKYRVDAHGAEGLQIGDNNTQRNIFGRIPPDQ